MVRLSALEREALAAFAAAARSALGDRVRDGRLFGSRARGEGRNDSDLDVLVRVERLTSDERRRLQDAGFDVGLAHRLVLSPRVADADSWRPDAPLAVAIARDGVAL